MLDEEDIAEMSKHRWHIVNGYVYSSAGSMHRLVMARELSLNPDLLIEHGNGNTLDNRKFNLEPATHRRNMECRHRTTSTTGSIGVTPTSDGQYMAKISVDKQSIFLGIYPTITEARAAYTGARLVLGRTTPNYDL